MIPGTFEYHAPSTVDEAIRLLGEYGDEAKLLAGGHSLLPMMKLRFAEPGHLIDLKRVQALRGIREQGGMIYIGAMTTENELIASELLRKKCPLIPEAAHLIADPQVRNCGTIGGDIVHGDPGNDHPAIMLATEASFVLRGRGGERVVPADGFFLGTYSTQLAADEILTEIRVPGVPAGSGHAYCKLKRKTGDFATAAAAVQLQLDGKTCKKIVIALTNAGPMALKANEAAAVLTGKTIDDKLIEQAAQKAMAICDPAEDLRGDREYKTHMAGEMTRRAIRQALARAQGK
ncbi:MAG TPA: xanthine dehydrogenase family protein subunit M [Candidatus Methylomirabilis sp.]|nr:xanthine dehydrogenase family protein subunit M [Candidatus Methylomirabilis sp.]